MPPPAKKSGSKPKSAPRKKPIQWTHTHLIVYLLVINLLITLFIGGLLFAFISLDIPDIRSLASYRPMTASRILDADGRVAERIFKENRSVVPLSDMPELLPKAFVAAEDARFFQHRGVDLWSVFRALVHNLKSGRREQGGSTITQQVARSLLLSPRKTYSRKIKEAILAYRIDTVLSKEEILHIYLNQIYLGSGAYGVDAAAQTYFGKSVRDLNLAESALLAGLPQAPSRYSPFKNFKLAKKRQVYVLNRMAEDGFITPTAARAAFERTIFLGPKITVPGENKYFLQYVRKYVSRKYGKSLLTTGGLTIHTTLDQHVQKAAAREAGRGVEAIAARHGGGRRAHRAPQAAIVAIETNNGMIRAMVGGTNFTNSQFNRAVQARRQPGSAFKPLIYAAALANGATPGTIIDDSPLRLQGARPGEYWEPRNFSGRHYGPTSLRNALIYSRNIVTIKLLRQTGIPKIIHLARQMGIHAPLKANLSLALGSSGLSLLELTTAYTVFANEGRYIAPIFIKKIIDRDGRILEENKSAPQRVIDERTAFQITNLLREVITEGTGKKAKGLASQAAGKTGTTDGNMDAWFIGFTPDLVAGIWVGFDKKISLGKGETGGRAAAPIWVSFMKNIQDNYPGGDFRVPDGITFMPVDRNTGEVTGGGDDIAWEPFKDIPLPLPSGNDNF